MRPKIRYPQDTAGGPQDRGHLPHMSKDAAPIRSFVVQSFQTISCELGITVNGHKANVATRQHDTRLRTMLRTARGRPRLRFCLSRCDQCLCSWTLLASEI